MEDTQPNQLMQHNLLAPFVILIAWQSGELRLKASTSSLLVDGAAQAPDSRQTHRQELAL
jgi:hypothetical protein